MSSSVLNAIVEFLRTSGVRFATLQHEPTRTSEASARARGEDVKIGAKAIVLKVDTSFKLFVLSAALKIDSKKVRSHLGASRTRFASAEELMELTGLVPGSVPPFGAPILELELYVDPSILAYPKIAFNAGSLTDSILMSSEDYHRVANPEVFAFSASD